MKEIVLFRKRHLLMLRRQARDFFTLLMLIIAAVNHAGAQQELSGVVTDGNEPLASVSISLKKNRHGTVTDESGRYRLQIPADETHIVVSMIGYRTQEIAIGNRSVIHIALEEDFAALDEVVVVGYGVQRKSDLTGAISQVRAADIENRSITRTEQALQGKAAGVQLITSSAQPGASPTIRVRGYSSNGSSDPLYVIDGLRVTNIGGLDPNNIASIEVLKDAASAAIYGAEAGNGVVLITTKSGTKGTSSISYDFQYALSDLALRPKLINAQQAIQNNREANAAYTDADVQELIDNGIWDGVSSTDWYNAAFERSPMRRHTVSFQGANDRSNYYLALAYLDDNGIVKGDKDVYKRLTGTINVAYDVKPWLKVGTNNNIEKYDRRAITDGGGQANTYSSMISRVMNLSPYFADTYSPDRLPVPMQAQLASGWTLLQDEYGNYYSTLGAGETVHPMVSRDALDNQTYGLNLMGTLFADFKPLSGLVFTSRLGYNFGNAHTYTYTHDYYGSSSTYSRANSASRSNNTPMYYQWENFANYSKTLGKLDFTAMLGTAYSENQVTSLSAAVNQVMKDDPLFADVSFGSADATRTVGGIKNIFRKLSYFGRLDFTYAEKYMLQATFRADAADLSVLPRDNRWGYFPALSAGWNISNEDFFNRDGIISFAKLRASWGQNGNTSNLGGYMYNSAIANNATGYSFLPNEFIYRIASYPSQLSNPELRWETSEQLNIGVDLRAFNDRLSIAVDWFDKRTKDLIVTGSRVPMEAGNMAPPINAGNVSNKGLEFEVGWKGNVNAFNYAINANIATLKNRVTYLSPNLSDGRIYGSASLHTYGAFSVFEVGHPVWYFWGYEVDHIDPQTGNPVFVDHDDNGSIDNNDKTYLGKPQPDLTYGVTLNASWRGLDMLIFGAGASGNHIFSAFGYGTISYNLEELYNQRWTPGATDAGYARPGSLNDDLYRMSDAYVFDGSFFKIKQIQLGYTLPQSISGKAWGNRVRLYASLDDWFVFTKYPGLDPEVAANATSGMGIDYGNYPNTKKTVFGLSLTF